MEELATAKECSVISSNQREQQILVPGFAVSQSAIYLDQIIKLFPLGEDKRRISLFLSHHLCGE